MTMPRHARTKVVGVAAGPHATAMMRRSSISSLACRSSPAPTICTGPQQHLPGSASRRCISTRDTAEISAR